MNVVQPTAGGTKVSELQWKFTEADCSRGELAQL